MAEPVVVFTGEPYSTVILAIIQVVFRIFGISWKSLFGLGETKINIQRNVIKAFFTPIFRQIHDDLGWPLHQYTFLDYKSWQVRERLGWRPDMAAWESEFVGYLEDIGKGFGLGKLSTGERQRVVRQYLANAIQSGWTPEMVRNLFRATVVAEYIRQNRPVPQDFLPPVVEDPPFNGWTKDQLDDYNWLIDDGFLPLNAEFWVNSGFFVAEALTPIATRIEQIPQWPGNRQGLSWDGARWLETFGNPDLLVIDAFLYYRGRQVTWPSWQVAVTQGPSHLVFVRPPSFTAPNDPQPAPQPVAPRYRCVQGACVIDPTGPFATLAECNAACALPPPPPPDVCAAACQGQIDALRSTLLFLKDFVDNTVFPLLQDAIRRANLAQACCDELRQRIADLSQRLSALEHFVFQQLSPRVLGLQQALGLEQQQRQDADSALQKRIEDLDRDWTRRLQEAEARAIQTAVRGVARALPMYLSPGNIAWWISQYPPPNFPLHEKVKEALAEQLAEEEKRSDPNENLLVRAPLEEIPIET